MEALQFVDIFMKAGPLGLAAVMASLYWIERKDRIEAQTRLYTTFKDNEQRDASEIKRLREERDKAMKFKLTRTENDPPTTPRPPTISPPSGL